MRKKSINTSEREKLSRYAAMLDEDDNNSFEPALVGDNWKTLVMGCGSNAFSQLALPTGQFNSLAFAAIPITNNQATLSSHYVQQVSSSANLSVAVLSPFESAETSSNKAKTHPMLYLWGSPTNAAVGSVFKTPMTIPLKSLTIAQISCGHSHCGFVTTEGKAFTWGAGDDGVLGHGTRTNVPSPKQVEKLKGLFVSSIACGGYHTAFIAVEAPKMQFVNIPPTSSSADDDLSDLLFSQSLGNHKFLVTGALYVCGQGKAGQLGIDPFPKPNAKFTAVPTQLAIFDQHGLQVVKVSCGFHHTAVIAVPMQSGRIFSTSLFTFGYGEFGRLGLGDEDSALSPKQVVFPAGVHPIDVACGEQHTVVACRDGNVYSWGSNAFGQLGLTTVLGANNDVVTTPQRVPLPEGMAVVQVAAGGRHTGAVTRDGKVLSWGWGEEGQLGHNSERNQLLPRPAHLPRLAGVVGLPVRLTMGMSHTLLLAYNARHIAPVAPVIPEETPAPVESAPPASPPKEEVVPPQPSPLPKPPSPAVHAPPPETHKPPILAAADDGDDVDEEEEEQQREEEEKVEAILPMAPVRGIKELLQQREERLLKQIEEELAELKAAEAAEAEEEVEARSPLKASPVKATPVKASPVKIPEPEPEPEPVVDAPPAVVAEVVEEVPKAKPPSAGKQRSERSVKPVPKKVEPKKPSTRRAFVPSGGPTGSFSSGKL